MRIGLLAPYNGTNLGDGATMIAMLQNLRDVLPGAGVLAITMDPPTVARLHGVSTTRITGLEVSGYSSGLLDLPATGEPSTEEKSHQDAVSQARVQIPQPPTSQGAPSGARQMVKGLPLIGPALRWMANRARGLATALREVGDWPRSFAQVRTLDLLIVSGGGQLHDEYGGSWGHPYAIFRWSVLAWFARTPVAFVSIGAQSIEHRLSKTFLRVALRKAVYRSYREGVSKRQLADWAFTSGDPVVADLAFSIDWRAFTAPSSDARGPRLVGLSPIAYGHAEHWPTGRTDQYPTYIRTLAQFGVWLIEQGFTLLVYRSGRVDAAAISDLKAHMVEMAGPSVLDHVREPRVTTVAEFFSEVSAAEYVVASRLHGVIMPHILGKPVLALSFDRKVATHMTDMGQEAYMVPIDRFSLQDLIERFELLRAREETEARAIRDRGNVFRERLSAQYLRIADLVRAGIATDSSR